MKKEYLEKIVEEVISEVLGKEKSLKNESKVKKIDIKNMQTRKNDKLNTGNSADEVYTRDVFSLEESPRLGCGLMEMEQTTFEWELNYDEIDYIIDGKLSIIDGEEVVSAGPGEIILIPKGSKIKFAVEEKARFLYVTYPADWSS